MATTLFSGHRVLLRAPGYPIVGIHFFGTAFSEPTLIRLASGFEAATQAASPPLMSSSATRPSTILKTALLPKCSDTDTDTVMQPTQEHKQKTKAEGEWKSPAIRDLMTNRMVGTWVLELQTSTVSTKRYLIFQRLTTLTGTSM